MQNDNVSNCSKSTESFDVAPTASNYAFVEKSCEAAVYVYGGSAVGPSFKDYSAIDISYGKGLNVQQLEQRVVEAHMTIEQLKRANRQLSTLHKRQDTALKKYETVSAEIPNMLRSHAEELRFWQRKCNNMQKMCQEVEQQLKSKEDAIKAMDVENEELNKKCEDAKFSESLRLLEQTQAMERRIQQKGLEIQLLEKKLNLNLRIFKQHLQFELKKRKDLKLELERARLELSGYQKLAGVDKPKKCPDLCLPHKFTENEKAKLESLLKISTNDKIEAGTIASGPGDYSKPIIGNDIHEVSTKLSSSYINSPRENKMKEVPKVMEKFNEFHAEFKMPAESDLTKDLIEDYEKLLKSETHRPKQYGKSSSSDESGPSDHHVAHTKLLKSARVDKTLDILKVPARQLETKEGVESETSSSSRESSACSVKEVDRSFTYAALRKGAHTHKIRKLRAAMLREQASTESKHSASDTPEQSPTVKRTLIKKKSKTSQKRSPIKEPKRKHLVVSKRSKISYSPKANCPKDPPTTAHPQKMVREISNIRDQIKAEYKRREAMLNVYYSEAANTNLLENKGADFKEPPLGRHLMTDHKRSLLTTLKGSDADDDNLMD